MEVSIRKSHTHSWSSCYHCPHSHFETAGEFERHIREKHSIRDGSMILCNYGLNGICSALQFGDLSAAGFKCHVRQHHLQGNPDSGLWTFFSSSQNLPAVLNDPNRGKQCNFFTKTWGDHFVEKCSIDPSPHLPNITLSHFESYCKKISKRLRKHTRLKENTTKPQTNLSISQDICEVPNIFYQQPLPLKNLETFQKVFPNLTDTSDATSVVRVIQENLSNYLDVIEMKISKQVTLKSDAFFHAMLSHDTVMDQMSSALESVQTTRESIKKTNETLCERPLCMIKLIKTRENYSYVLEKLKLMSTVQQTQPMIQLLLSTSDYVAALDLINSTQKVLSRQLTGILAFRHLSPQLTEMERLINKMLHNEFQRFAVSDLNRPLTDINEMPEKDKLVSVISGILRLKESDFINTFKNEAMTTVQTTLKQLLIEIISEREGNVEIVLRGSGTESSCLMGSEGVMFLKRATPYLLTLLRRISVMKSLILEVSQMDNYSSGQRDEMSLVDQSLLQGELAKMMKCMSDYSNERCANLLVPKNETENILTSLNELTTISKLIDEFSKECENITGHCSNTLKLTLRSFSMKFIQSVHNERRNQLTAMMNTERWKTSAIPYNLQAVICEIAKANIIPRRIRYPNTDKPSSKFLIINNQDFAVPETVQLVIRILLEYCEVGQQSPMVIQYVVHCMLELVRLFNSQCCQLVLGAGALQSAGLKTITTSNLALVSRSLQVVLWLLPIIKQTLFSPEFNPGVKNLGTFDVVYNDIVSHKDEIEKKIITIVSSLLSGQLIGWEARPPVPSQTFRAISKHLVKLHEALSNILPLVQIQSIYRKVHHNFKEKLREQLVSMNIAANGGPQHGVVTSELTFYLQTLKTLKVITDDADEDNILFDIWIRDR